MISFCCVRDGDGCSPRVSPSSGVGLLALTNIFVATVASIFFVGTMMLLGGAIHIVFAFQVKRWGQVLAWVLVGALYVVAGLVAFSNPLLASSVLTLPFALSILGAGVFRVVAGIGLRQTEGWGWLVATGILTIVAAASSWPAGRLTVCGLSAPCWRLIVTVRSRPPCAVGGISRTV